MILVRFIDLINIFKFSRKRILAEPCVLCNNNKFIPIVPLKRKSRSFIILCSRCGLGKIHPMFSNAFYNLYYRKYYNELHGVPQSTLNQFKRGIMINEFVKSKIDNIFGVFEIGCAGGGNLLAFKHEVKKIKLGGLDPSEIAISIAKKRGITAIRGFNKSLNEKILKDYNLIIISHVIEHFINPYKELLYLSIITTRGTHFYIETPNSESPVYKVPLTSYWFRLSHTYYYTEFTLRALFKKCGFTIIKFEKKDRICRFLLKNDKILKNYSFRQINYGKNQLLTYKLCALKSVFYLPISIKQYATKILRHFSIG